MSRKGMIPVCLRAYKDDYFAVLCQSIYYKDSIQVKCAWLDGQGQLQEGVTGILDALEADAILVRDARDLWRALKKRFGRVRNIVWWKEEVAERIKSGEGVDQWPELL